jgi:Tfp pilus assembly protein PilN
MKIINLLPKNEQKEVKLQFFAHSQLVFWIWIVISLVLFLILTLLAKIYLNNVQNQVAIEISQKQEELKSSDNAILKQQVETLNTQIKTIKTLQGQHVYWSNALVELGNLLAPDIQLNSLSIDRTTGKIDLQGTAGNRESVLKFWSDIHKSQYFQNIDFPLSNLNKSAGDPFTFTFYANLDKLKQE